MRKHKITLLLCIACMCATLLWASPVYAADTDGNNEPATPTSVSITLFMPDPETAPEPVPELVPVLEEPESEEPAPEALEPDAPIATELEPKRLFPVDVTEIRENGEWQIIKTYDLHPDESPMDIPCNSFERSGWQFSLTDIIRRESTNVQSLEHVEPVTVETETNDLEQILSLLPPTIEYKDDDGFTGVLTLDISSIKVETAGTKTSSYTSSVTREYPHLSSNDTSLLPKTVQDRGKTYTLSSVDWRSQRIENIDYTDLPTSYTAIATYTAAGTSTRVLGYATTALYTGMLTRLEQGKTLYIACFIGEEIKTPIEIEAPPQPTPPAAEPINANTNEPPAKTASPAKTAATPTNLPDDELVFAETQPVDGFAAIDKMWIAVIAGAVVLAVIVFCIIKKGGAKAIKKPAALLLAMTLASALAIPTLAADYEFESGGNTWGGFGKATTYEANVVPSPLDTNTRRNKDAALTPPPYGVFSGDIPTDPSSPYHDNLPDSGFVHINQDLPPVGNEGYAPGSPNTSTGLLPSTSQSGTMNTVPWLYDDGSLGTLTIHKLNKTIKVYEGESLENMKKGIGHFSSTSAWDGNVGLAGHNRGAAAYFSFVKDLKTGDLITYTTRYGTRTYEVSLKERISETDFSSLRWTTANILTLITCVENVPELRWCVQAREIL